MSQHNTNTSDDYQNNFNMSTYPPVAKLELAADQSMVYPGK